MKTTITGFNYSTNQASEFEIDVNFSTELICAGQWKLIAHVDFLGKSRSFSKRVFAGFIDELDELKESNPTSDEIDQFCAKNWPSFETDESISQFCDLEHKSIIVSAVHDVVIDYAIDYFANSISSYELIEKIELPTGLKFSEKKIEFLREKIVIAQEDWDLIGMDNEGVTKDQDEKFDKIIADLAKIISENIY